MQFSLTDLQGRGFMYDFDQVFKLPRKIEKFLRNSFQSHVHQLNEFPTKKKTLPGGFSLLQLNDTNVNQGQDI
jgi:hypothetical protein